MTLNIDYANIYNEKYQTLLSLNRKVGDYMRFMPFVKGKKGFQMAGGGVSDSGGGGGGYVLPSATSSTLGGVKIGTGVEVTSDGTISVSGGGGGSIPTYSPVEHQVTVWQEEVGGVLKKKPVYQKTVFDITPSTNQQIVVSNIDRLIDYSFKRSVGSPSTYFILYDGTTDSNKIGFNITSSHKLSIESASASYSGGSGTLSLFYTKSTDEWETV